MPDARPDPERPVLVADPDRTRRAALRRLLEAENYTVLEADGTDQAVAAHDGHPLAAAVLDLEPPETRLVLQHIRRRSRIPVIVLAETADEPFMVGALDLGADDVLLRRRIPAQLTVRLRTRLRRHHNDHNRPGPAGQPISPLVMGGLVVDQAAHTVTVGATTVNLTAREFALLTFLAEHSETALSREQILTGAWGTQYKDRATVTEHVRRIRRKLAQAGLPDDPVTTMRGTGYLFRKPSAPDV